MRNSLYIKFCACKDSANRRQYKISSLIFIVEMPPILFKDSAKNRLSEAKTNLFVFVSVRFLLKSKTTQNIVMLFYAKRAAHRFASSPSKGYLVASHGGDAVKQSSDQS